MDNVYFYLPSGNWFTNFKVDTEEDSVVFDYFDRRRGQVARRYRVVFSEDSHEAILIKALSVNAGRVEYFSTCRCLEFFRLMWWSAKIKAMEEVEEEEEEEEGFKERALHRTEARISHDDVTAFVPVITLVLMFVLMMVLGIVLR